MNTAAPQNDNQLVDILNGLRLEILEADLPVNAVVIGNSLRITSINASDFTLAGAGGIAGALVAHCGCCCRCCSSPLELLLF